jgi:hypothetical protein
MLAPRWRGTDSRARSAYHEAGHAVAAARLGWGVAPASLRARGVAADPLPAPATRAAQLARLEAEATVLMAGAAAEFIAFGDAVPPTDVGRLADLGRWALGYGAQRRLAYRLRAEARAEALLRAEWPAVRAVAAALLERGELDRAALAALIAGGGAG